MSDTTIRIGPNDTTNELAASIHNSFLVNRRVTILTDDANQYNLAVKASAIVRRELIPLGVDLVCSTFFQFNDGRYQDRDQLQYVLTDRR